MKEELHRLAPRDERGRLKEHLHRRLTRNHGYIKLKEHLAVVVALMQTSDSWTEFIEKLDRARPKPGETMRLPF